MMLYVEYMEEEIPPCISPPLNLCIYKKVQRQTEKDKALASN